MCSTCKHLSSKTRNDTANIFALTESYGLGDETDSFSFRSYYFYGSKNSHFVLVSKRCTHFKHPKKVRFPILKNRIPWYRYLTHRIFWYQFLESKFAILANETEQMNIICGNWLRLHSYSHKWPHLGHLE